MQGDKTIGIPWPVHCRGSEGLRAAQPGAGQGVPEGAWLTCRCCRICQMMQRRLELSYPCSCSTQGKEEIISQQTPSRQTIPFQSTPALGDAFQVRSGQGTRWPSVPETLINATSKLGIEIFLFSLSTASSIFLLFFIYIIICKASFELQCTKHYTKEWTTHYFISYIGNRERRYNHHKKECLTMADLYGGGRDDHYVIFPGGNCIARYISITG